MSQTYSTENGINKLYDADWKGAVPTISVTRDQNPKNGLLEKVRLNIELSGIKPEQIAQIQVLGSFSYELKTLLKIQMLGMIHIDLNTQSGAGKIYVQG
jgi:hypothetical protein